MKKETKRKYTLGKEIANFYEKQRQDKERKEGGQKTQPRQDDSPRA